ncbi:MAG: hypothetical protein PWR13_1390 [Archaeoglobi archaeon]|nr:Lrp/AsnC family transcriptional regulator [Candidatus Mnemosynella bozhongmuii]MDI3503054.1 hypothetical protein [Archaeoglobi archaeon]MDK2782362.1 hypothetical protein [Archaeoglobi archaeon]
MDGRDRMIIEELLEDGRRPLMKIAERMGISVMAVKKRLERLLKDGIIRISPEVNARKMNLLLAIVAIEIEDSESLEKFLEKFRECPRIIKFFVTTSGFNLFALIYAEDLSSLESISLEKCSLRSQKGIRRFEIYPVQEIHYDPYLRLKVVAEKRDENAPCGVYCGDCRRYMDERCLGCPATSFYRGKL